MYQAGVKGPSGTQAADHPFFNGWTWNQTQQFGSNGLELANIRGKNWSLLSLLFMAAIKKSSSLDSNSSFHILGLNCGESNLTVGYLLNINITS